jgi:hypothetical protein
MNNYDQVLSDMQIKLAKAILERIQSPEATAADFQAARMLLKDNQMFSVKGANPSLEALKEAALPSFDELKLD